MPEQTSLPVYEAEVLPGLESFAAAELRRRFRNVEVLPPLRGGVPFMSSVLPVQFSTLRTVTAVYRVLFFAVARPKALLGHQHFTALTVALREIIGRTSGFDTLSIDAAGADSTVMQRLKAELAEAVHLRPAPEKGDLHLRLRPSRGGSSGWEALIRLTPRPLATRPWRLHNVQGALNAPAAAVMAELSNPTSTDSILNLCCGSASLMVERALAGTMRQLVGVDIDAGVLSLAHDHLGAADIPDAALICGDVTALPFSRNAFDVLLADIPFGQLVGSHDSNLALYPALLREAARVACPLARFVLITHEKRLMDRVLQEQEAWRVIQVLGLNLNGLHPNIYVLEHQPSK